MAVRLLCLPAAVLALSAQAFAGDNIDEAIENTQEGFQAVTQAANHAAVQFARLREALLDAWNTAKGPGSRGTAAQKDLLDRILQAAAKVGDRCRHIENFSRCAGCVDSAFDVSREIKDLCKMMEDEGVPASVQAVLATAEKSGDRFPAIAPALQACDDRAGRVLEVAGKLTRQVDEARRRGLVGAGTSGAGISPERNGKLKEQLPDLAEARTFMPDSPAWVYVPAAREREPMLIWDSENKAWSRVPAGVNATEIYHRCLLTGARRTPAELSALCRHWDRARERGEVAEEILRLLKDLQAASGPARKGYDELDASNGGRFRSSVEDPERFAARYMYDAEAKIETDTALVRLHERLGAEGADAARRTRLEQIAERIGLEVKRAGPAPNPLVVNVPDKTDPDGKTPETKPDDKDAKRVNDFTLAGPSSSHLFRTKYRMTNVRIETVINFSKPGVVLDTVGLNAAQVGSFALSVQEDGIVSFSIFDPKSASKAKFANGWHVLKSTSKLKPNVDNTVHVELLSGRIRLIVAGKAEAQVALGTALSGEAVYVGDFPGDDKLGEKYRIHAAMTGTVSVRFPKAD